jgi:hypothetical protein
VLLFIFILFGHQCCCTIMILFANPCTDIPFDLLKRFGRFRTKSGSASVYPFNDSEGLNCVRRLISKGIHYYMIRRRNRRPNADMNH